VPTGAFFFIPRPALQLKSRLDDAYLLTHQYRLRRVGYE
jgi:hypothetical protein